jgi:hypothetical protein
VSAATAAAAAGVGPTAGLQGCPAAGRVEIPLVVARILVDIRNGWGVVVFVVYR